jgi:hypothetical protein
MLKLKLIDKGEILKEKKSQYVWGIFLKKKN